MKSLLKILLISMSMTCLQACGHQQPQVTKDSPPKAQQPLAPQMSIKQCICPQVWLPVCSEEGKTFSNSCFANCAGVKFKQGSCSKVITD